MVVNHNICFYIFASIISCALATITWTKEIGFTYRSQCSSKMQEICPGSSVKKLWQSAKNLLRSGGEAEILVWITFNWTTYCTSKIFASIYQIHFEKELEIQILCFGAIWHIPYTVAGERLKSLVLLWRLFCKIIDVVQTWSTSTVRLQISVDQCSQCFWLTDHATSKIPK